MAVNSDFEGRKYDPSPPFLVGRESVRDFARAVGARSPLHHDVVAARAAGYRDVVAPPTYAVVIAQRCESQYIGDPEAGIDFSRVVHVEERFEMGSPLVAGDEVIAVLQVERARAMRGNGMITTRCELFVGGEPVGEVVSTLLVRAEEAL
ncbi:Acyl dehydratase [Austwickia chelonae]|uniref:FAS1-like dehydratase domain-containing protein n=1 Tax=Austwickia chelonae NBRC 105200 TaxID=1184607 RepID=K6V795_9MICO|nr:MaoC family dehydratase N-terminal domain-containing protein [Austwickia chelonae]GAB78083.1 hypothetical protein AUCHE_08_03270 [Austwickia chelonae NBRC 105200]SEV96025.1 Acyl dehydratase [Austwickia chelonae]